MPNELVEHRKELIKFAWNHLKSEDMTTRQCAHVLVCRFIEAYDTPPKIILQVYIGLLKAYQPEAKVLVKQALDILTPGYIQKSLMKF
jgi:transformation/transcription domain-associated protein